MSFFNSDTKLKYKLIISLKSSSIDFQFLQIKNNKRTVLFLKRNIILLKNPHDSSAYTSQYSQELEKMLKTHRAELQKISNGAHVDVGLILYAPWFNSRIYSIAHPGPIVINERFLQSSITDIDKNPKVKTIEKRVIKINVNGYTLNNLIRTKSENIKVDLYSSSILKTIYIQLTGIIQNNFPVSKSITLYSSPLLYLDKIKELMVKEDNITHIFIGGEVTELSIIKDDSLVYVATFPIGKHDFLRELQNSIQSYDYDLLYHKQYRFKSAIKSENFETIRHNWQISLKNLLENYGKHIPSKILITTDKKTQDFFIKLVTNSIQDNNVSILCNHRIINFDISGLKDIIEYNTPINEGEIDLILEALV